MKNNGYVRVLPLLVLSCSLAVQPVTAFELDAPFVMDDEIPVVLTASRLKQPRAEVPASVTVIEAEQIRAWGVRTIPELLRFVPGMTLGHSQGENTDTVVYHASGQNFMRRMQILVDGRSVYKSAIASINWDDIPIALEDIRRIEITRGPNSATYGANAFLAVINIISKAPEETLGTRVRYRSGNQSVSDGFISHSALAGQGSYRLSAARYGDDGFDGRDASDRDEWDDDSAYRFVAGSYHRTLTERVDWELRGALNRSEADIGNRSAQASQSREADSAFVQSTLMFDFSPRHTSRLNIYWQREKRTQMLTDCVSTVFLDPALFDWYRNDPNTVLRLLYEIEEEEKRGTTGLSLVQNAVLNAGISPTDPYLLTIATRPDFDAAEKTCGDTRTDLIDERIDLEWQDTVIWTDTLRTVSGINLRRDQAHSDTLFNGSRRNDLVRLFANVEWRIVPTLLMNAGATYEDEGLNDAVLSPRVALNWLWSEQQSVRLVWSQAVRSPDMLEQEPEWTLTVRNLTDNYLGLTEGRYFMSQYVNYRGLDQERITSYELGYYHMLPRWNLEVDVKVYRDQLRDLISDAINIETLFVESDTRIDIQGAEMQLHWRFAQSDWLWMTLAYTDVDTERLVEARLSPEKSAVLSWHHQAPSWSSTLSYFWLDSLNNGSNLYHRSELNLRKHWQTGRYRPWVGGFWQHQFERNPLGHPTQMYATRNIYYLQAGLEF